MVKGPEDNKDYSSILKHSNKETYIIKKKETHKSLKDEKRRLK